MLIAANAEVVTTHIAIKIVVKRALLAVFEEDTDKACTANQDRGHFFDNDPSAPLSIIDVDYFISQAKIEAFSLLHIRS
jgi:hypothetical protein